MSKKKKITIRNKYTYKNDYSDLLKLFKELDKKQKTI